MYLMRIVTPVSFAQVSKPGSVGQNRGGVYGEQAVDSGKPNVLAQSMLEAWWMRVLSAGAS